METSDKSSGRTAQPTVPLESRSLLQPGVRRRVYSVFSLQHGEYHVRAVVPIRSTLPLFSTRIPGTPSNTMFSQYGRFDIEGDISSHCRIYLIVPAEGDTYFFYPPPTPPPPLPTVAGFVLWNMMQIWGMKQLIPFSSTSAVPPLHSPAPPYPLPHFLHPPPSSPGTRILINRVTAPRFAFYTISRRHGEMCEVFRHFWRAEKT